MPWSTLRFVLPAVSALCLAGTTLAVPGSAGAAVSPQPQPRLEQHGAGAATGELAVLLTLAQTPAKRAALAALAADRLPAGAVPARRAAVQALRPPASERTAVTEFAASHQLTVAHLTSASVLLTGPAATLATVFATTITSNPAGLRYAASTLQIPAALRSAVSSVSGLDERPMLRPRAVPGGYTGDDFRAAYRGAPVGATGAGVTVAVLQSGGWVASDLSTYASAAGITLRPDQITQISIAGADPTAVDSFGSDFEVAMDSEAILAIAPAANQRLYFAPNSSAFIDDAVNQMADDAAAGLVQVASTSWGACEPDSPAASQVGYGSAIDRLLAAGATYFAASGDSGSYDCSTQDAPDNRLAVDFPASYPNVVAAGGTRLSRSGAAFVETGWGPASRPATGFAGNASGGGASAAQPRPGYQRGLGLVGATRLVPDVSSDADPATGLGVYASGHGGWSLGGGTSLAAPTWAGFTAAALSSAGRTVGFGNILPALYANPAAFRDITTGQNGEYTAGAGYDLVTGLGSPLWDRLTPLLVNPLTISGGPVQRPAYGSSFAIGGSAAPRTVVMLRLHRAGTPADDYSIVRMATADATGSWSSPAVADDDYRYFATAGSQTSASVLNQPAPLIGGPTRRTVPKNQTYPLVGQAVPTSTVFLHFHRGGTPASDYSIVRSVVAGSDGRWVRPYAATTDFRVYVSRSAADSLASTTFLLQAR